MNPNQAPALYAAIPYGIGAGFLWFGLTGNARFLALLPAFLAYRAYNGAVNPSSTW
jgi:hypothetical protein